MEGYNETFTFSFYFNPYGALLQAVLDDDHTKMNLVRSLVKGIQKEPQTPTTRDKP